MSAWINIADKKPEPCMDVLACNRVGAMVVAQYSASLRQFWTDDNEWGDDWFCYWMPLPEQPEGCSG